MNIGNQSTEFRATRAAPLRGLNVWISVVLECRPTLENAFSGLRLSRSFVDPRCCSRSAGLSVQYPAAAADDRGASGVAPPGRASRV